MARTLLLLSAALTVLPAPAWADDPPALGPPPAIQSLKRAAMPLERVLKNPDDMKLLSAFLNDADQEIGMLNEYYGDTAAAERRLKEFEAEVAQIAPTTEDAKKKLESAKANIHYLARQISPTLSELETKLTANADDLEMYRTWAQKVATAIEAEAHRDPNRAQAMNEAAQGFAAKLAEKTQNAAVQRDINRTFLGYFKRSRERQIETGRKLVALIGSQAPPLQVSAWVNSKPLTLAELQGKVVLLDFWTLAPNRIGSVPDIQDWHARFADKGLMIIAVTINYASQWDAAEHRLTRSTDFIVGIPRVKLPTVEQEKDILTELAKFHKLNYPLTSWSTRDAPDSPYNFGKIRPGLVVIDRQGKIRMIRVLPRAGDARELESILVELLAPPKGN